MNTADGAGPLVSFDTEGDNLCVSDALTDQSFSIGLSHPPTLDRAPTAAFLFPVDDAVTVSTSKLVIPGGRAVILRNQDGDHLGEFSTTPHELSEGTYYLEVSIPVKTYVRIPRTDLTGVHVDSFDNVGALEVTFPEETQIEVGARSTHDRPRATITVPDDPRALMDALSVLPSSIKEWSAERSWPTLRGHPPAINVGEELDIPAGLQRPKTGVTVEVPETYADVYRVAPLAYYLGATVVPGDEPTLRLDNGFDAVLGTGLDLEATVSRQLATCLTLDSLVRIGGYYSFPRYEYDALAPELPFYPPNLADQPLSSQLLEYFEVPETSLAPYAPQWPVTASLRPTVEDARFLPHVLNGLWRVHITGDREPEDPEPFESSLVTAHTARAPPSGDARLVDSALVSAATATRRTTSEVALGIVTDHSERAVAFRDTDRFAGTVAESGRGRSMATDVDVLYTENGVSETRAAVAVTAGENAYEVARTLVDRGAVSAVALADRLDVESVARLLELVRRGFPLGTAASFLALGERTEYRFVGHPTFTVADPDDESTPAITDIVSTTRDSHRVESRASVRAACQLGSLSRFSDEFSDDEYHMTGVSVASPVTYDADELADHLEDISGFVRLNSEVVRENATVTATDVRRSADALSDPQ